MTIDDSVAAKMLFDLHARLRRERWEQVRPHLDDQRSRLEVELLSGRTISIVWYGDTCWGAHTEDWSCVPIWFGDAFIIEDFAGDRENFIKDMLEVRLMAP